MEDKKGDPVISDKKLVGRDANAFLEERSRQEDERSPGLDSTTRSVMEGTLRRVGITPDIIPEETGATHTRGRRNVLRTIAKEHGTLGDDRQF